MYGSSVMDGGVKCRLRERSVRCDAFFGENMAVQLGDSDEVLSNCS